MMAWNISYSVQQPGGGAIILNVYRKLAAATTYNRLTGCFAFASLKGVILMTNLLKDSPSWSSATKRWIISIDGGITEPKALKYLLAQHKTEVRVPYAETLLSRRLRPLYRFHPKTLLFERQDVSLVPTAIIVGSANLTYHGLCLGHEHVLSAQTRGGTRSLPHAVLRGLSDLEYTISQAEVITSSFIDRYAAIRPATPRLPVEFEDKRSSLILQENSVIPPIQAAALAAAIHFWVEIEYVVANRGKSGPGNQIDLARGSRVFFGFGDGTLPRNSPIGTVTILYGKHAALRNLRFGNNSMDKLDLPIPGIEGPQSYSGKTLLFSKVGKTSFRLAVGAAKDVAAWKAKSRASGTLFTMKSGRKFGVF